MSKKKKVSYRKFNRLIYDRAYCENFDGNNFDYFILWTAGGRNTINELDAKKGLMKAPFQVFSHYPTAPDEKILPRL
jgi:hypothetical protein